MENSQIATTLLICAVVVGVVIYFQKKQKAKENLFKKDDIKPSNLKELSDKFKDDYFNEKLSDFALTKNINFEKVKEIYPKFQHTNLMAQIDWSTFTGRHKELEDIIKNWDKYQNLTILDRYIRFLKESYENELNSIKAKIKELK
ncbi:hypothetical protein [Campylobacter hominis]|uniref:Putative DNA double-strand break repair Rad50 ATPase n=1 Tax=Campylobacter hominis (strain ATCC BAA-381 / DSM 21671 / CCUG 45161 / LMG 19568 / NCTC 13146 / CH001A) TaxID=360107 RepID=A7I1G9_CAMHC|nr:hypothetical protein [Campylobacter hominis]ABS51763.1 putative DNA double-strand break repair Rad50 ATPase [Campylobacter hominis ATCC BAA-381]UAK86334.1 DNA double-strand break repair protein Rad50 [Campylobacter hominis]SUW84901.1 putative DNA double-strand break repair Rad50 ATPase [Campylobacter hominis]